MSFRQWMTTCLGIAFLVSTTTLATVRNSPAADQPASAPKAQALPQRCLAAGLTTKAECEALIAKQKAAGEKAASDKAAGQKALVGKAADDKASADKAAAEKAAQEAAASKAATDKADAEKAASDQTAVDQAAAQKAAADKTATDKAVALKAAADKSAADKANAVQTPAVVAPLANKPILKPEGVKLAKDCIDAGVKTLKECEALHAIAGQNAKSKATVAAPAEAAPAPAPDTTAGATPAPTSPAGKLPAEVSPAKPLAAKPAEPPSAQAPALPEIAGALAAAGKSYNRSAAVLAKPGSDQAAAGAALSNIKAAQARIDALCKSDKFESTGQCLAQYAIHLAPIPSIGGGQPVATELVQPVEVIKALPKGVEQSAVAPLLDSAKDEKTGKGPAQLDAVQPTPEELTPAQTAAANAPAPKTDKAAQADLKPGKVTPIDQQKGQQIDANAITPVQVPQNVTIVNQTVVNNTTNTAITNNNAPAGEVTLDQGKQIGRRGHGQRGGPSDNPIGLGLGIILQFGNQLIINSPAQDQRRIAYNDHDRTDYERLAHERYRETIIRPDGVRIVTIYNRNGDILRRSRFDRDGIEIVLAYFDDRHDEDLLQWRDPGEDLPPLRLRIPARDYVLDADDADQDQVQVFFAEPPVERVQRLYSIAEVKRSARIRDMVRRLEIGNLSFDTGAATLSQDQVANLSKVASAMLRLLERNPAETFLIEGHTDAVGSDISNLQLSDERAATVAQILTEYYQIPPENLATQGYGERYLKVQTELAEPLNRRVTVRRITSLVTIANR